MRLLYKPVGLLVGVAGGMLARRLFNAAWGVIDDAEPPKPTTQRASWARAIGAAALQGAIFRGTKAAVDRAGATSFAHVFGVWPGERDPDKA